MSSTNPTYYNSGSDTNLVNFNNAVNPSDPTSFPYTLTNAPSGSDIYSDFDDVFDSVNGTSSSNTVFVPTADTTSGDATVTLATTGYYLVPSGDGSSFPEAMPTTVTAAQMQLFYNDTIQALQASSLESTPAYPGVAAGGANASNADIWAGAASNMQEIIDTLQGTTQAGTSGITTIPDYSTYLTNAQSASPTVPFSTILYIDLTGFATAVPTNVPFLIAPASYSFLSSATSSSTPVSDQALQNIAIGYPSDARTGQLSTTSIGSGDVLSNFVNAFASVPTGAGTTYTSSTANGVTTYTAVSTSTSTTTVGTGTTYTDDEDALTNSPIAQALLTDYEQAMGITVNADGTLGGDWADLSSLISQVVPNASDPPTQADAQAFVEQNFLQNFQSFIQNYNFNFGTPTGGVGTTGTETTDFLNAYSTFLTNVSTINTGSVNDSGTPVNVSTLYDLYTSFVPGGGQADFQAALQAFYQKEVAKYGYFNPSQDLQDWVSNIETIGTTISGNPVEPIQNNSQGLAIFFKVFSLLVENVQTLQQVAASQFNRLTFYSNLAQAYTNLLSDIPQINEAELNGTGGAQQEASQSIQAMNTNYSSIIQAYQNTVTSQEKEQQTDANNTNQAVDQCTTLLQTILTNLNTVLQSISQAK
jgi:hypothetical protein